MADQEQGRHSGFPHPNRRGTAVERASEGEGFLVFRLF